MKVVHINAHRGDGAALCALRISKALKSKGVETHMIVSNGVSDEVFTAAERDQNNLNRHLISRLAKNLLLRFRLYYGEEQLQYELSIAQKRADAHVYAHLPVTSFKNLAQHPLVEQADLVHLHWVSGFVDYPTFFKQVKKPIVWTIHDKYPAVGLLHYCSEYFPVPDTLKSLDRKCCSIKRKAIQKVNNLHLVALSKQMLELCTQSDILQGLPISLIHNGVYTDVFTPQSKKQSRKLLNLPLYGDDGKEFTLFLACGFDLFNRNKGLVRIIQALERVKATNKMLLCVGLVPNPMPNISSSFPIKYFGPIRNEELLSKIYSAADFFIQASYEESFGQTLVEAMSCGTPVISTPCGIAPEIIHPNNGVLCDGFEVNDLYSAIQHAVDTNQVNPYQPDVIRSFILNDFSYEDIATQYLELYNQLLR